VAKRKRSRQRPDFKIQRTETGDVATRADGLIVCDFCLAENPQWEYEAKDMAITAHPQIDMSQGAWAACGDCVRLIEANDVDGLLDRCVREQRENMPEGTPNADGSGVVRWPSPLDHRDLLRPNLVRFFFAKRGSPVPIRP